MPDVVWSHEVDRYRVVVAFEIEREHQTFENVGIKRDLTAAWFTTGSGARRFGKEAAAAGVWIGRTAVNPQVTVCRVVAVDVYRAPQLLVVIFGKREVVREAGDKREWIVGIFGDIEVCIGLVCSTRGKPRATVSVRWVFIHLEVEMGTLTSTRTDTTLALELSTGQSDDSALTYLTPDGVIIPIV